MKVAGVDGAIKKNCDALRTHQEIADILTARGEPITKGGVFMAEKSALAKIASDPVIRELAVDLGLLD